MSESRQTSATSEEKPPPALRRVHLVGGLRATDFGETSVSIEVSQELRFGTFPKPPYPQLYASLSSLGLHQIGVDFISDRMGLDGITPPEFEAYRGAGFRAMDAERAWGDIRHLAGKSGDFDAVDIAARCRTYIRLLVLRLRELSEAYNRTLRAHLLVGKPESGLFFGNLWLSHIDAAIHGFTSDAGSFRDLLAEATWRLVLRRTQPRVTTLKSFLKLTKGEADPLSVAFHAAGDSGGWLKNLSDLRNAITHAAPMSNTQQHHFCELRDVEIRSQGARPMQRLHYPLMGPNEEFMAPAKDNLNYDDEEAVRASMERYRGFMKTSIDALDYVSITLNRLIELCEHVRLASGLKGQMVHITDEDLIGPVEWV